MNPSVFRSFIESRIDLSEEEWNLILTYFEPFELPKNHPLLIAGDICREFYFLEEGMLRFFLPNFTPPKTKYFTFAPFLVTSQRSFVDQIPAIESIQTLTKCRMWSVSFERHQFLYERLPNWQLLIRKLIQEVQYDTEDLLLASQSMTAEDRYKQMLSDRPEMIQNIPLKHLASFLGIAPESLSRIRKKVWLNDKT